MTLPPEMAELREALDPDVMADYRTLAVDHLSDGNGRMVVGTMAFIALLDGYAEMEKTLKECVFRASFDEQVERADYAEERSEKAEFALRKSEAERERMRVTLAEWETWWHRAYDGARRISGQSDNTIAYEISAGMFMGGHPDFARATLTKDTGNAT